LFPLPVRAVRFFYSRCRHFWPVPLCDRSSYFASPRWDAFPTLLGPSIRRRHVRIFLSDLCTFPDPFQPLQLLSVFLPRTGNPQRGLFFPFSIVGLCTETVLMETEFPNSVYPHSATAWSLVLFDPHRHPQCFRLPSPFSPVLLTRFYFSPCYAKMPFLPRSFRILLSFHPFHLLMVCSPPFHSRGEVPSMDKRRFPPTSFVLNFYLSVCLCPARSALVTRIRRCSVARPYVSHKPLRRCVAEFHFSARVGPAPAALVFMRSMAVYPLLTPPRSRDYS